MGNLLPDVCFHCSWFPSIAHCSLDNQSRHSSYNLVNALKSASPTIRQSDSATSGSSPWDTGSSDEVLEVNRSVCLMAYSAPLNSLALLRCCPGFRFFHDQNFQLEFYSLHNLAASPVRFSFRLQ